MAPTLDYEPRPEKPQVNLWIIAWVFVGILVGINSQFPVVPWLSGALIVAAVGLSYLFAPRLKVRLMVIPMMYCALALIGEEAGQNQRSAQVWRIKYLSLEREMKLLEKQLSTQPTTKPAGAAQ